MKITTQKNMTTLSTKEIAQIIEAEIRNQGVQVLTANPQYGAGPDEEPLVAPPTFEQNENKQMKVVDHPLIRTKQAALSTNSERRPLLLPSTF